MSKISWHNFILPTGDCDDEISVLFEGRLTVERCIKFKEVKEQFVVLEDPRAYRSMSLAAVLLAAVCKPVEDSLKPLLDADPYSIGIYCALEQGPLDFECAKNLLQEPDHTFLEKFKKGSNPKQYFHFLPNIAVARLGIMLNIMGPITLFHHSEMACIHALEQAELDLYHGKVKAALVCSAFSLENPLLSLRAKSRAPELILSEGASAIILLPDGKKNHWDTPSKISINYGIATTLVHLAQARGEAHA